MSGGIDSRPKTGLYTGLAQNNGICNSSSDSNVWHPSMGISFAGSVSTTTWNPASSIVFSTLSSPTCSFGTRRLMLKTGDSYQRGSAFTRPTSLSPSRSRHLPVPCLVPRRAVSTEALPCESSKQDPGFSNHGLGRAFGDDEIRKPIVGMGPKPTMSSPIFDHTRTKVREETPRRSLLVPPTYQMVSQPSLVMSSASRIPSDQQENQEPNSGASNAPTASMTTNTRLTSLTELATPQKWDLSLSSSSQSPGTEYHQQEVTPSESDEDSFQCNSGTGVKDEQPITRQTHTFLSYQIPEAALKNAMLASRSTGAAYWQYTLYQSPVGERVKVHYCKSKETTERVSKLFLDKEVLGFDIEWKPNAQATDGTKKNVSLIQLASEDRIALFHVARFAKGDTLDDLLAPTFKTLIEDPAISKVGVSIKSDCTRLRKFMGISARGLFELSHLYKLVKYSSGYPKKIDKKLVSLAQQVEEHLQLPLAKGAVRSSDWSADLDYKQISYAASDSYAGLQLYDVMEGKRKSLSPTPPRPSHAELNLPIRLANGQTAATADEPQDEPPDDDTNAELTLPDIEVMARDFMNLSLEDSSGKSPAPSSVVDPTKPPEVLAANVWVSEWKHALPASYKARAAPAQLRAYALWHHQAIDVPAAAGLLRDPPLLTTTVSGYILEAIRIEKLPFDQKRLGDVLGYVSESVDRGKYTALRKEVR